MMNLANDITSYAWRGSGKYVLLTCVVLSMIAKFAGLAPLIGPIASILISGYFCAIFFQLIQSSATGSKEAPEFPETSNLFEDIIWPMLQITIVGLVSFGPAIGYGLLAGPDHYMPAIGYGLLAFGLFYFPMAMLAVVVLGYIGALSPHIVIPSIFRGGWLYGCSVLMLAALYVLELIIQKSLTHSIILGPLIVATISTYTMMTHARILGVVYRERQEELGWL